MAVQAQHLFAPAFLPHDVGHALRALEGAAAVGGSALLDELHASQRAALARLELYRGMLSDKPGSWARVSVIGAGRTSP